jgi:HK97 family phage major capsid protein
MHPQYNRYKDEADRITRQKMTPESRSRLQFLLSAMSVVKNEFRSTDEKTHQEEFRDYLVTGAVEKRTVMTEANTGMLVPASFYNTLLTGIAQYTELMSRDNVNLIESEKALPLTIPTIDLSTITSAIVAQGVDAPPVANPTISSLVLGGYSYRTNPIASTFELEQDSFETITDILTKAFSVGLARGIGSDLVNGSGSGAPLGILNAASNSGVTSALSTNFSKSELEQVYFACNRAYRVSPKAAWLMHDTTYQQVRALLDTNARPLINITEDGEKLFGKRILISPDMPVAAGSKAILFGDLGQFQVRVAKNGVLVRRNVEAPGYAEKAAALYTAYMRVDSALNTAGGDTSPVVFGTLHS